MTSPNGWDAAEARRLRRVVALVSELMDAIKPEHPDEGCPCASCAVDRLIASCEGEVGE